MTSSAISFADTIPFGIVSSTDCLMVTASCRSPFSIAINAVIAFTRLAGSSGASGFSAYIMVSLLSSYMKAERTLFTSGSVLLSNENCASGEWQPLVAAISAALVGKESTDSINVTAQSKQKIALYFFIFLPQYLLNRLVQQINLVYNVLGL